MPGLSTSTVSEITFTLRDQPYNYFHLQLIVVPVQSHHKPTKTSTRLDEISLRQYLSSALIQSFGITGSAIPIDILKAEGSEAWIRVQSQDAELLQAALAQWSSEVKHGALRVCGRASWLGGLGIGAGAGSESKRKLWSLET